MSHAGENRYEFPGVLFIARSRYARDTFCKIRYVCDTVPSPLI